MADRRTDQLGDHLDDALVAEDLVEGRVQGLRVLETTQARGRGAVAGLKVEVGGVLTGGARLLDEFVGDLAQCSDLLGGEDCTDGDVAVFAVGFDLFLAQHGHPRNRWFDRAYGGPCYCNIRSKQAGTQRLYFF